MKVISLFLRSSGLVLLLTGTVKILSSFGNDRILNNTDPVFGLSFQHVFWIAGLAELGVAMVCFSNRSLLLKSSMVGWLATCFAVYRFALIAINFQAPCHCLGSLKGLLHVSNAAADVAMKIILAYLLISSYGSLFWLWRQRKIDAAQVGA